MNKSLIPALTLLFSCVYSQNPLTTDRPDQTESPVSVRPGQLQIESGISFTESEDMNASGLQRMQGLSIPSSLFRVGLVRHLELRVVVQPEYTSLKFDREEPDGSWGFSDIEAGFKLSFTENPASTTHVGFLAHLLLPTGSSVLSKAEIGVVNKLAVAHQFSEKHNLSYNLGYDYTGEGRGDLTWSLS